MAPPLVSVVLPFYRNPLVLESVESILSQTFHDLELIAIDDCSGNGVADVLSKITDPRLRLIVRERNGGENVTRNHGVSLAQGKYIAFQDHDDISYPNRIAAQVAFLESNPSVAGIGTYCHYGQEKRVHVAPLTTRQMWWDMIFNNHVMFPTVMVRTEVARRHPFGDLVATDDYRWLYEVMQEGDFVNIPEIAFHYRMQETSLSKEKANIQLANLDLYRTHFAAASGTKCSAEETRLLRWLGTPRSTSWDLDSLTAASRLLTRLLVGFQNTHPGDMEYSRSNALARLRYATTVSADCGIRAWINWNRFRQSIGASIRLDGVKLLAKCALRVKAGRQKP